MNSFGISTTTHCEFTKIDAQVQDIVTESGIKNGVCHIFIPHTTAGVTINENADPDVIFDTNAILEKMVPWKNGYAHAEGNSAAHVKASLMGSCQTVLIMNGRLALGTWQSIFFTEFDGPRSRKVWVQVMGDSE